ncbi:hypothetical protein [Clostridium felsineum]|uniref:hypothetical protein n=1 Tax=Clostridium felsineum TaxID=36839 RepID=UPI001FA8347F|nr:hypothetical protein [Clostridium felsineum]
MFTNPEAQAQFKAGVGHWWKQVRSGDAYTIGQTTATVLSVIVNPDDVSAAVSKAIKAESLLGKMGTFSKSIAISSAENAKNIATLPWGTIDNLGSKVADLRAVLSEGKGAIGDFRKSVVVSSAKNAKSLLTKVKSTVSDVKTISASFAKAFGKTYAKECRKYVNTCFSASGAAGADLDAYRAELRVSERNTVAVGKTDVKGLEKYTFKGASPQVIKDAKKAGVEVKTIDEEFPNRSIKAPWDTHGVVMVNLPVMRRKE